MTKLKVIVVMWCLNFLFWVVSGVVSDYSSVYELWFKGFAGAAFVAFSFSKIVLSVIMLFLLFDSDIRGGQ